MNGHCILCISGLVLHQAGPLFYEAYKQGEMWYHRFKEELYENFATNNAWNEERLLSQERVILTNV